MENKYCLNCNYETIGKFCHTCGQKTDTHRITAKHFFMHDLLHGVWHIEKGILFTIKQALLRPGAAALEYIEGKRIRYYNVFYLILLVIGLTILLSSIYDKLSHHFYGTIVLEKEDFAGRAFDKFISDYAKLIIYSFVPFFALNTFILFRRKKLNFSEHLIIAGMTFLGVMTINLIGLIFSFTNFLKYIDFIARQLDFLIPIVTIFYVLANYYRTFKNEYKISTTLLKLFLFLILMVFEVIVIAFLLIGFFTEWKFEMK